MDVILHIGAHRTGTTTFQTYLEDNRDHLNEIGTEFWGPNRTRSGLFSGLVKRPDKVNRDAQRRGERANGLIRMELDRLEQVGLASLVVSEENMIGSMWDNLSTARLYGDAQARLDRFASGFGFHCKRVAISIRSYDKYWASVLAFMVQRGWKAPDDGLLDRLVTQSRRWQDVIRDVAAVFPAAELVVWPFEGFVGQSDQQLAMINNGRVPVMMRGRRDWHNASPSCAKIRKVFLDRGNHAAADRLRDDYSRWQPFGTDHIAAFQGQYDEDIAWLRGGADGLATYVENTDSGPAGIHLRPWEMERGHSNDQQERSMG
ncbi:hypothetical protein [Profundibacter amoris]|nr:hypothetical protein [Profundibacter amoris]